MKACVTCTPTQGSRALRLIDLVEAELPRLLAAHPDIGRPAQLSLTRSKFEQKWLERLAPLTARRLLQAREWLPGARRVPDSLLSVLRRGVPGVGPARARGR